MNLREQPPLPKSERDKVKPPEKISQSALAKFDSCPRSAFLYWKHKGGYQSPPMIRGEIFHEFVEESVQLMVEDGSRTLAPEIAKANVMGLVRDRKDVHLPEYEQDALRRMAWNWGEATAIDPENVVGIEQMIELEVGSWTIRGKLDFAEIGPFGALVRDYKTSISVPNQEDVEKGSKSFQGRFYALLLLFGTPEGEALSLGAGLNECRVELAFPRFTNSETGELIGREVTWTRDELTDFRDSLAAHLEAIDHGFDTGEWPAQTGSHCNECPARSECPLPDRVHPVAEIQSTEEAAQQALAWHLGSRELEPLKKSVRAYCDANGLESLPYDADYELAFVPETRRSIDWKSVAEGEPVSPDLITTSPSVKFTKRKIKERNGA